MRKRKTEGGPKAGSSPAIYSQDVQARISAIGRLEGRTEHLDTVANHSEYPESRRLSRALLRATLGHYPSPD